MSWAVQFRREFCYIAFQLIKFSADNDRGGQIGKALVSTLGGRRFDSRQRPEFLFVNEMERFESWKLLMIYRRVVKWSSTALP